MRDRDTTICLGGGGGSPDKQVKNSYILQNNSILLIILKVFGGGKARVPFEKNKFNVPVFLLKNRKKAPFFPLTSNYVPMFLEENLSWSCIPVQFVAMFPCSRKPLVDPD